MSEGSVSKSSATIAGNNLAVILLRGRVGFKKEVRVTLDLLNLEKKFTCCVVKNTPSNVGMVRKVKDAVTWGEVSDEVVELIKSKRKAYKNSKGEDKLVFSLHPPIGGFEKGGIKTPFNLGGSLGYRKEAIGDLIKKMI